MRRSQPRSGSRLEMSGLCSGGPSPRFERRWIVRHVPDGVLRRLDDEPLAVPDRVGDHVAECARCRTRRGEIADDTEQAARLLSVPQLAPDSDLAWARLERELYRRTREGF